MPWFGRWCILPALVMYPTIQLVMCMASIWEQILKIKQTYCSAVLLHSLSILDKSDYPDRNDWNKIYTLSQYVLAACQSPVCLSSHASAHQTHFTNRAICLNEEGGVAGLWCCCAPAVHAHINACWGGLDTLHTYHYLVMPCHLFLPIRRSCRCSLTWRIYGTVQYSETRAQTMHTNHICSMRELNQPFCLPVTIFQ